MMSVASTKILSSHTYMSYTNLLQEGGPMQNLLYGSNSIIGRWNLLLIMLLFFSYVPVCRGVVIHIKGHSFLIKWQEVALGDTRFLF